MTDGAPSYGEKPPHGSLGDEATRLAEAVQGWLGERTGRAPRDVWAVATGESEQFHSPECRVCPLCRAMRFVTSMSPQVVEHLAEAAASFSAAMRAMGEDVGRAGGQSAPAPDGEPAPDGDGEA